MNSSGVSYKQIRVSSTQGSFDTSGSKNIADFYVPNGSYDLSQSTLCIKCSVSHTDASVVVNGTTGNQGIFDSGITVSDSADNHYNLSNSKVRNILIKNARVENEKLGVFDSAVRHNQFMTNINALKYSPDEDDTEVNFGGTLNGRTQGLTFSQPIDLLNKQGAELSQQRPVELEIPLKSILNSNVIDNYQSSVHGNNLHYNFEMRLDKLVPTASVPPDAFFATPYNNGVDNQNNNSYGALQDTAAPAGNVNLATFDTQIKYQSINDSPYYTGGKYKISYTLHGSAPVVDQICKIVSLEYLNTNDAAKSGCIRITFDGFIVNQTAGNTVTAASLKAVGGTAGDNVASSLSVDSVELKMMELVNAPPIKLPQMLTYERIRAHNDGYPAIQSITKNYYIPPRCKTVFITFPESGGDRSSSKDSITTYRVIVDNEPITDSVITYKSGKHYDLQRAAFLNAGGLYPLKNLNANKMNANGVQDLTATTQNIYYTVLAFPVKFVAEQQVMNLELNADANMSGLIQINYQTVENVSVK